MKLLTGLLMLAAAGAASAQSLDKPLLLVAAPELVGFYRQAVLLVVSKGDGHVGFMINRATRTTVASAFPKEPELAKVAEPVFLGGPTDAQSMYAVVRRDPGEGARRLFGELFVTVSGRTVDRIMRESPREARYFAGYAAWDPAELAEEIERGEWLVTEAREGVLFGADPDAIWAELLGRLQSTF